MVASDSVFIAENTETNTFMLTGQVVDVFLMFGRTGRQRLIEYPVTNFHPF